MKEENKKSKKKVLLYYLILAACLLVIAAVTVTVIFTVDKTNPSDISTNLPDDNNPDNPDKPDDGNKPDKPDNPDNPDNPDKPTGGDTGYGLPVETASVTNKFVFGYDVTLDRYCVHKGMDFEAKEGDKVCAVLDGTVSKIVQNHIIGENYVTLSHKDGVTTTYKYIDAATSLKEGDTVKKGDLLGTVAKAGGMEMKQGEHLHFEVRVNGALKDPDNYLEIIEK